MYLPGSRMLRCAYWLLALLVLPMQNVALAEDNTSKDKSAVDEAERPKKEPRPAAVEGAKSPAKAKAAPAKKQTQKQQPSMRPLNNGARHPRNPLSAMALG